MPAIPEQFSNRYAVPAVLEPIQLLDVLELSGTTTAAAQVLGQSQSTVSRRSQAIRHDLKLQPGPAGPLHGLRFHDTGCLRLLRRASQWHRLEAGAVRIGGSPWQPPPALRGHGLALPLRFRHPRAWCQLLEAHCLDAAVLSGLELRESLPAPATTATVVRWGACLLQPLAVSAIGVLMPPGEWGLPPHGSEVVVPARPLAPGLAAWAAQHSWRCRHASPSCQEPEAWAAFLALQPLPLLCSRPWALALAPVLPDWPWRPLPEGGGDQLWLLQLEEVLQEHRRLQALAAEVRSALVAMHPGDGGPSA